MLFSVFQNWLVSLCNLHIHLRLVVAAYVALSCFITLQGTTRIATIKPQQTKRKWMWRLQSETSQFWKTENGIEFKARNTSGIDYSHSCKFRKVRILLHSVIYKHDLHFLLQKIISLPLFSETPLPEDFEFSFDTLSTSYFREPEIEKWNYVYRMKYEVLVLQKYSNITFGFFTFG